MKELKETIKVTETTVECPVKGCRERVPRQRGSFKRLEKFKCPKHHIYISPTTFEYQNELDNILWKDKADLDLLKRVVGVKRESRITHDNSEDAVTWNVFRFLEKTGLLSKYLSKLIGRPVIDPEVIYWSYSQSEKATWSPLQSARREFETRPERGPEPDLIIKSDDDLIFIEAKFTANNNTVPENPEVKEKYETGGGGWYRQVLASDFESIAIAKKKYELMRFWLIGSWIAHLLNLNFYLVNLVLGEREKNIERIFKKHIKESSKRSFLRSTWEDIYRFILDIEMRSEEKDKIVKYFENKTIGYNWEGKLQKAFST